MTAVEQIADALNLNRSVSVSGDMRCSTSIAQAIARLDHGLKVTRYKVRPVTAEMRACSVTIFPRLQWPRSTTLAVSTALLSAIVPVPSYAVSLPTRHVLTLETVHRVETAAEAEARQHNWSFGIAIADTQGYLVALVRTGGSRGPTSVELARTIAGTRVRFGKSQETDPLKNQAITATTAPLVETSSDLPIIIDSEDVGTIGVSSARPDWDRHIAEAGASALAK